MTSKIMVADVKLGDFLTPDAGFDCMKEGVELEVKQDPENAELYIDCSQGEHYLSGQYGFKHKNQHGELIGFTKHRKSSDPV